MLILLPPSEGKTAPSGDATPDLFLPQLARARQRVLGKLVTMCSRSSARAMASSLAALGLSPGQAGEVTRNAGLLSAPAAPAAEVYTGVLYEALDVASLPAPARAWVEERVVVFSGLWGVVRLTDRIPAYRCSVGATLPGLGGLGAYWKKALSPALDQVAGDGPVLDLRSGAYGTMWTPAPAVASRTAQVRVLHERVVDGVAKRSVVSHFNKATKGRLVRALATVGALPESVDELVTALRDDKFRIEELPRVAGRPRRLDVIVAEV